MLTKFQKMQISKGHLLTVKGDVQMIKDAFLKVSSFQKSVRIFIKRTRFI